MMPILSLLPQFNCGNNDSTAATTFSNGYEFLIFDGGEQGAHGKSIV